MQPHTAVSFHMACFTCMKTSAAKQYISYDRMPNKPVLDMHTYYIACTGQQVDSAVIV